MDRRLDNLHDWRRASLPSPELPGNTASRTSPSNTQQHSTIAALSVSRYVYTFCVSACASVETAVTYLDHVSLPNADQTS